MSAIQSITITDLQRLKNITVNFEQAGVTAIMGVNGSGKTTLLQALACIYKPDRQLMLKQDIYRYDDFFKPYVENDWLGASFAVSFYGRDDAVTYSKLVDRWCPSTQHKTSRYVKYVSILDCVPDQEKENKKEISAYIKSELGLSAAKKRTLLSKVSAALNKEYTDVGVAHKDTGLKDFLYVATHNTEGNRLEYPSHYMGAGEQKIIYIINEVLKAPKGSLILVEELDISLHESAIRALINFLLEQTLDPNRQLQVVFTTHWLGIQSFVDQIKVISLYENDDTKEIVLRRRFDPQFIHNLNGDYQALRQIKLWVEDGLAVKLVEQVAEHCAYRQFVDIKNFGSVQNAYTVAGAIAMANERLERTLIITDGDTYLREEEKQNQIKNSVDGRGVQVEQWRENALKLVVDLDAPNQAQPEIVLLDLCRQCVEAGIAPGWLTRDLLWISQQRPVIDGKEAFRQLAQHKGMDNTDNLERMIIQEASRAENWTGYIQPLIEALNVVARNIGVLEQEGEPA